LLSKLTTSSEPEQSGIAGLQEKVETEAVQTPVPESEEQVNKDILNRLTGGSADQDEDKQETDESQAGGSGDA
jgi:hypothetical protein